jgi:MFS superfamily sulfate permease-like transporter
MWFACTYVAMVGLGPAVFSVPGAAVGVLVLVVFVAVADSWALSDFEPQPTRTRLKATAVIATPLTALACFIKHS